MKLDELHVKVENLTEEQHQEADYVLEQILDYFTVTDETPLMEEDGGGGGDFGGGDVPGNGDGGVVTPPTEGPGDGTTPTPEPTTPPVQPPGGGAWFGGFGGAMWFNTFIRQMRWLAASTNVKKRLKELGIKGDAINRIDNQIKMSKKHVNSLLSNPMQFNIKQFQYVTPSQKKSKLNGIVKTEIKKSLVKLPKGIFLPGSK